MHSLSDPLWKRIAEETLWGRRGLSKINLLWLTLAVLLFQRISERGPVRTTGIFQVILTVVFWLSANILANNLGDRRDDRAAGKPRWICDLSLGAGAAIVAFLMGGGFAVLFLSKSPSAAKCAYSIAIALGLAYSLRPLRLKDSGSWGIFTYCLACTCGYVVLPWAWLKGGRIALLFLAPAVLLDKWVNLHFHQVVDYEPDRASGIRTLAVRVGPGQARQWLKISAGLTSLWLLAVLVYGVSFLPKSLNYAFLGGTAVILVAAVSASIARPHLSSISIFTRELPVYYLVLTFLAFRVLPLLLFFVLALRQKSLWPVLAVSLALVLLESWNLRRPVIS
jgi:4-hydroxybenzoate polyprenyltransferase